MQAVMDDRPENDGELIAFALIVS